MQTVNLLFPHQLFETSPLLENAFPIYLVEEYLFFRQYAFHQQKIAFHRASMRAYADYLEKKGKKVIYVAATEPTADVRTLLPQLKTTGVQTIHYHDPTDNWLEKRLIEGAKENGIALHCYENPTFLNQRQDLLPFFSTKKKKFFQTSFYIAERKKRNILLDAVGEPIGGQWSFDKENRKRYPRKKIPPKLTFPAAGPHYREALDYVQTNFSDYPGTLPEAPLYPYDFASAKAWLSDFLTHRLAEFGTYEDAMVREASILHHSVLSPLLNVGLLTPQQVLDAALTQAEERGVPLNSLEGFVRQVMGWREFIRGVYEAKGSVERTRNFWGFSRKIPASFYDGTTGIEPVDHTIRKVLQTGYCHHIERLMILGNFMLLCEFDPDEVYRWFMELFIDAYDWVMVPNVYGMSQFADGGLMSTKPYISGSNYMLKMSDYEKGPWQAIWDALFWRFMSVHRDFFTSNPRLGMLVGSFDRMAPEKQTDLLNTAEQYLEKLEN